MKVAGFSVVSSFFGFVRSLGAGFHTRVRCLFLRLFDFKLLCPSWSFFLALFVLLFVSSSPLLGSTEGPATSVESLFEAGRFRALACLTVLRWFSSLRAAGRLSGVFSGVLVLELHFGLAFGTPASLSASAKACFSETLDGVSAAMIRFISFFVILEPKTLI